VNLIAPAKHYKTYGFHPYTRCNTINLTDHHLHHSTLELVFSLLPLKLISHRLPSRCHKVRTAHGRRDKRHDHELGMNTLARGKAFANGEDAWQKLALPCIVRPEYGGSDHAAQGRNGTNETWLRCIGLCEREHVCWPMGRPNLAKRNLQSSRPP